VAGRLSTRKAQILLASLLIAAAVVSYVGLQWSEHEEGSTGGSNTTQNASSPTSGGSAGDKYAQTREVMVRAQIEERGVEDKAVLAAMRGVPRHEFVPDYQVENAYEDRPLSIGYAQTISQPYIVALMTEMLKLEPGKSRALEIGTGSGYQAAILAKICSQVYSIEIVEALAERASLTLDRLGFTNVHVKNGDGYYGWEEHAPYDAIVITCAASHIPPDLVSQLADGGRLVLPLGSPYTWQTLTVLTKKDGETTLEYFGDVIFVPMTGAIENEQPTEQT